MADPLRFTALDHISLTANNQQGALDFYSRLFGANLRKESDSERYYVRLGSSYMAVAQAAQGRRGGYIDHYCAGCEGVWLKPIEERLKEIGVMYTIPPPFGIFFTDPDGIRTQLWTGDSWLDVARTAPVFARPVTEAPLFEAVRIFNLNIGLPDVNKATPYYERLFGTSQQGTGPQGSEQQRVFQIGKSTLTLRKAAADPGLESVGIQVKEIRSGDSVKLRALGATPDSAEAGKRINFRDPEGVRISVIAI